tara:strand:- start:1637 stop:1984 length:348 start_codon:yes stop_codon:yes gene_type:complete
MKISKERLKQIIKEELELAEQDEQEKIGAFGTERVSASGAKQQFKQRAQDAVDQADEYTNLERGIVQQLNDVLEQLALAGDIDQGQLRGQMQIVYKRLAKILDAVKKQKAKGEQK